MTYDWYEAYKIAVLETEWSTMPARLEAAEDVIHERQRMLSMDHGGTLEERQAIAAALSGIRNLKAETAEKLQRDLILLDLALPKLNGMEAARRIRKVCPHSRIIFLSQDSSPEIVEEALRQGAAGYLLKSDAIELPLAIDEVLHGRVFVSSSVKTLDASR